MSDDLISREDVLSGKPLDRRPARVLGEIEMRCAYMQRESRRVIEAYFLSDHQEFTREFDLDYFQKFKLRIQAAYMLTLGVLECYAPYWKALVPEDPVVRAQALHLLAQKYPVSRAATPRIREAFGFDDLDVREAFQKTFGRPIDSILINVAQGAGGDESRERAASELETCLEWVPLKGGEVLYRQGQEPDGVYIVVNGRLRVSTRHEDGVETVVAELSRGEIVGELGVLTGEKRTTTVRAIRDSETIRLPHAELERLADEYPQLLKRMTRIMAYRLSQHGGKKGPHNTLMTFALIAAGPGSAHSEVARQLAEQLGQFGPVLHLHSQLIDEQLLPGAARAPAGSDDNSRLLAWLNEQESQHRYVVYEADGEPSEWTRRCLRQADRILIVADATADPAPGEIEIQLKGMDVEVRAELVLMHPEGAARAEGTHRWLTPRHIRFHHHLRRGNPDDMRRLARRITGRALALVLGGGAALGLAHIGVLRALDEAGLPMDVIGGSSMGAVIGAAHAIGMDHRDLLKLARKVCSRGKLFDPTLPVVSFFSSGKATGILRDMFGDTRIEDLWRPFFCMSSNLTHAMPMVHRDGPLWLAVRASSAIPGVFSPILYGDDVLVDGAVLNNLPVDVMSEFSEGSPVVAVNVFPEQDLREDYKFGPSISGWAALASKLNPLGGDIEAPTIFENIVRVIALNDAYAAGLKRQMADLYIAPPLAEFGILDFGSYKKIIEVGYRSAQQALEGWSQDRAGTRVLEKIRPTPARQLDRTLEDLDRVLEELAPIRGV